MLFLGDLPLSSSLYNIISNIYIYTHTHVHFAKVMMTRVTQTFSINLTWHCLWTRMSQPNFTIHKTLNQMQGIPITLSYPCDLCQVASREPWVTLTALIKWDHWTLSLAPLGSSARISETYLSHFQSQKPMKKPQHEWNPPWSIPELTLQPADHPTSSLRESGTKQDPVWNFCNS